MELQVQDRQVEAPKVRHTPGPWQFFDGHVAAHEGATMVARVFSEGDFPCLEDEDRDAAEIECNANGLLIASAPEMLAFIAGSASTGCPVAAALYTKATGRDWEADALAAAKAA